MIQTEGSTFNRAEGPIYFIAAQPDTQQHGCSIHPYILVALNELTSDSKLDYLCQWYDQGARVLLDSGIFWLATSHAKAHGLTMDEALALAPSDIDGFDQLWERYLVVMRQFGPRSWGYIELDQGGRENKIKTRAKLEALGLKPIPVYHPINDGWDYFDHLAQHYDRICFGNVVQADARTRRRLISTMWERHRKYPHLWVHLLGLTPTELMLAYPANSADSSTWLGSIRYPQALRDSCSLRHLAELPREFQYKAGELDGPRGAQKACQLSAAQCAMLQRNWRNILDRWKELGCEVYPPP